VYEKIARKQPLIKQLYNAIYTRSIKVTALIKEGRSKVENCKAYSLDSRACPTLMQG
jgi:hypothetical protein